ncbi:MAG: hypothetical protein EOO36_05030 [Cytophagaceae bacterium]|nr:MAG: hypothetical protein EOO36_05030 [Cytophagaceae bacterium]
MRLYLTFIAVLLLAGCAKVYGPQRLDFVGTTRYTSSSRTGLGAADTLATRVYAENTDKNGAALGRLKVTVTYLPKRAPFLYPTPANSLSRDLIDNNPEDFVYLDSTLTAGTDNILFTNVFGVRTTTGAERWTYQLYNSSGNATADRAVQLSMRRSDSLYIYHDYILKLVIPAVGVRGDVRAKSSRRFLSLLSGLALPAYTVVRAGAPDPAAQEIAQKLIDLIILPDGLTLVSPDSPTLGTGLNSARWPAANRRATLIYPAAGQTATTFASQVTDTGIKNIYTAAAAAATGTTAGKVIGPVRKDEVYAFRTSDSTPRYGLLYVVQVPVTTATTVTVGLQLQVRMAKL